MHVSEKWKWSRSVVSNSSDPVDYSLPGSSVHGIFQAKVLEWDAIAFSDGPYSPWNSLSQNTGVGSLSLLQGIFPTQGSNPGLLHCRQILYQLSHKGTPRKLEWKKKRKRKLEWVVYPFSRSSRSRNWTGVSCIAEFFTNWATREAQKGSS